jgi:hypothetical protein
LLLVEEQEELLDQLVVEEVLDNIFIIHHIQYQQLVDREVMEHIQLLLVLVEMDLLTIQVHITRQ